MYPIPNYISVKKGLVFRQKYPNNPVFGSLQGKEHLGLDLVVPVGTPIYAPFDGVVTKHPGSQTGECVWFAANGFLHRFAHLLKYGGTGAVKEGDVIAISGNTGISTGPHIHHDISKGSLNLNNINNFVDPLTFNYSSSNNAPMDKAEVYKNIFIAFHNSWPSDEQVAAFVRSGKEPYSFAQSEFINPWKSANAMDKVTIGNLDYDKKILTERVKTLEAQLAAGTGGSIPPESAALLTALSSFVKSNK